MHHKTRAGDAEGQVSKVLSWRGHRGDAGGVDGYVQAAAHRRGSCRNSKSLDRGRGGGERLENPRRCRQDCGRARALADCGAPMRAFPKRPRRSPAGKPRHAALRVSMIVQA